MPRSFGQPYPLIRGRLGGTGRNSFSLPELMVAIAVLVVMLGFLMMVVTQSSQIWQRSGGQKSNRQAARILLELIGSDLESASFPLNTNSSRLRFRLNPSSLSGSGALNPDGMFWQASRNGSTNGDVEDVGWFVQWVADASGKARGTLCRMIIPPTNSDSIFGSQTLDASLIQKYAPGLHNTMLGSATAYKGLVAENVLGLWITLYSTTNSSLQVLPSPYDSSTTAVRPTCADISVAVLDPRIAERVTPGNLGHTITNQYGNPSITNAAAFIAKLPAEIQAGAQAFETRIQIHAGH